MLTNKKLEALKAERKRLLPPNSGTFVSAMQLACKSINFIEELLAIREAGDEEVEKLYNQPHEPEARKKLRDIAIARGQTRTDAVNKAAEWAKECGWLQEQLREAKRREQIMTHHCQKYVEMTWEQAEAAYDAAEPVEISNEEIDRIMDLVVNGNEEDSEENDLRQQLREARAEIERLKKILCHVPSRVALEAKESAGYGEHIYPKGEQ